MKIKPKYFSYLLLVFIAEYVVGTVLTVGFSYLFYIYSQEAVLNNHHLSVFVAKIVLFLTIILIIKNKSYTYVQVKFPRARVLLWSAILVAIAFVIFKIIVDHNFSSAFDTQNMTRIYLFSVIVFGPIYEELLYRGVGIGYLKKNGSSNMQAILFTSVIFSLIHLPEVAQAISSLFLGLVCSYMYTRYKNILYPIIFHIIYNFFSLNII